MVTLLTGENDFAMRRALLAIECQFKDDGGGQVEKFDGTDITMAQLPDIVMGATLFASKRLIVIDRLSDNKSIWSLFDDWMSKLSDDTDLVLIEPKPDKRTHTYKWLQKNANVIDNPLPKQSSLQAFVVDEARRLGIDMNNRLAQALIDRVGTGQWDLVRALEKLSLVGAEIDRSVIEEHIDAKPQATAFELIDAIVRRDSRQAERLLSQVRLVEDAYKFAGLLGWQFYTLAAVMAADGKSKQQIATELRVNPFVVGKMQQAAGRLSGSELSAMIEALRAADNRLKSTGADPWDILLVAINRMISQ